jgi:hypothetical protein
VQRHSKRVRKPKKVFQAMNFANQVICGTSDADAAGRLISQVIQTVLRWNTLGPGSCSHN